MRPKLHELGRENWHRREGFFLTIAVHLLMSLGDTNFARYWRRRKMHGMLPYEVVQYPAHSCVLVTLRGFLCASVCAICSLRKAFFASCSAQVTLCKLPAQVLPCASSFQLLSARCCILGALRKCLRARVFASLRKSCAQVALRKSTHNSRGVLHARFFLSRVAIFSGNAIRKRLLCSRVANVQPKLRERASRATLVLMGPSFPVGVATGPWAQRGSSLRLRSYKESRKPRTSSLAADSARDRSESGSKGPKPYQILSSLTSTMPSPAEGWTGIAEIAQSPQFSDVQNSSKVPVSFLTLTTPGPRGA